MKRSTTRRLGALVAAGLLAGSAGPGAAIAADLADVDNHAASMLALAQAHPLGTAGSAPGVRVTRAPDAGDGVRGADGAIGAGPPPALLLGAAGVASGRRRRPTMTAR